MQLDYTLEGYSRAEIQADPALFRSLLEGTYSQESGYDAAGRLQNPIQRSYEDISAAIASSSELDDHAFISLFNNQPAFTMAGMGPQEIADLYYEAGEYILAQNIGPATDRTTYGLLGYNAMVGEIERAQPAELYAMFHDVGDAYYPRKPVPEAQDMLDILNVRRAEDLLNGVENGQAGSLIDRLVTLDVEPGGRHGLDSARYTEADAYIENTATALEAQCPGISDIIERSGVFSRSENRLSYSEAEQEIQALCNLPNNTAEESPQR